MLFEGFCNALLEFKFCYVDMIQNMYIWCYPFVSFPSFVNIPCSLRLISVENVCNVANCHARLCIYACLFDYLLPQQNLCFEIFPLSGKFLFLLGLENRLEYMIWNMNFPTLNQQFTSRFLVQFHDCTKWCNLILEKNKSCVACWLIYLERKWW
jgi:hypothetical protein